jgi:hypothetical protein
LLVGEPENPRAVASFTISEGRIVAIDLITNAEKLRHVSRPR